MKLSSDLLDQAEHLATKERKKPKQASLRRSISATYYSMFHFLIDAAIKEVPAPTRHGLRRAFGHKGMKDLSKSFAAGKPDIPDLLKSTKATPVHDQLRQVATAFVSRQDARHEADYNLTRRFYAERSSRSSVHTLLPALRRDLKTLRPPAPRPPSPPCSTRHSCWTAIARALHRPSNPVQTDPSGRK